MEKIFENFVINFNNFFLLNHDSRIKEKNGKSIEETVKRIDEYCISRKPRKENDVPAEVDFTKLRVLIAEDFPDYVKWQIDVLTRAGVSVEVASGGKQAVEMFAQSGVGYYDVVLTELSLPDIDGGMLTEYIRGLNRRDADTVVIIAVAVIYSEYDVEAYLCNGIDTCIAKPMEIQHLYEALQKYLKPLPKLA